MKIDWALNTTLTAIEEFSPGQFSFVFENYRINLSCPWRIVAGTKIQAADSDHGQQFGLPSPVDVCEKARLLLSGNHITGGQINTKTGDFVLEFDGKKRLEVFNNSSGYEAWSMQMPDGRSLIAISGGEVCSH